MKEITNKCPVCGKTELKEFDICDTCGWENDLVQQAHPDVSGGANQMSLNEAKKAYANGATIH